MPVSTVCELPTIKINHSKFAVARRAHGRRDSSRTGRGSSGNLCLKFQIPSEGEPRPDCLHSLIKIQLQPFAAAQPAQAVRWTHRRCAGLNQEPASVRNFNSVSEGEPRPDFLLIYLLKKINHQQILLQLCVRTAVRRLVAFEQGSSRNLCLPKFLNPV
jgi:hypothetical protein